MDVLDNVLSTQGVSVYILDQFSFLLTDLGDHTYINAYPEIAFSGTKITKIWNKA